MNKDLSEELDGIGDENGDIRYLFSYNLQRLAGMSSRIAAHELAPKFGLSTLEWRALAVLDFLQAAPLNLLAERTGIQRSQISRLTVDLESNDLVQREANLTDRRSTVLKLTQKGRSIVDEIMSLSRERNRRMLSKLNISERRQLMRLIGKATAGTAEYLEDLKSGKTNTETVEPEPASLFDSDRP